MSKALGMIFILLKQWKGNIPMATPTKLLFLFANYLSNRSYRVVLLFLEYLSGLFSDPF